MTAHAPQRNAASPRGPRAPNGGSDEVVRVHGVPGSSARSGRLGLGPDGARTLRGHILGDGGVLVGQDVESHDLTGRDVLLHVAVKDPGARIRRLETDDRPAAAPQADHILLQRVLQVLNLAVPFLVVGAAPVGIVGELRARVAGAGVGAIERLRECQWQEETLEVGGAAPRLGVGGVVRHGETHAVHVQDVRSRGQVVDYQLDSLLLLDGDEGDTLGAASALGVQQRGCRLLPRLDLGEHVHPVGHGIRNARVVESRADDADVHDVLDICLLGLLNRHKVLDHGPTGLPVRVPLRASDRLRLGAATGALGCVVATEELLAGLAGNVLVPKVLQEGPVLARVNLGHVGGRGRLQEASQVVDRLDDVVARCLVGTHDDVEALARVQVELRELSGLDVNAVHGDERHVVPRDADLEVLCLPHHPDEAQAVARALLDTDHGPRVLLGAIAPLAVPRRLLDLHADRVSGLRSLGPQALVGVPPLVADGDDLLLLIQGLVRVRPRVDDDGPLQAPVRLHSLHVRVPPMGACLAPEAVGHGAALGGDAGLRNAVDAIEGRVASHVQAVPMDGNSFSEQVVGHLDAHQLALEGRDGGTGVGVVHQQGQFLVGVRDVERPLAAGLAAQIHGWPQVVHDPISKLPCEAPVAHRGVELIGLDKGPVGGRAAQGRKHESQCGPHLQQRRTPLDGRWG
mmetsp:Transcript_87776/g.283448  ORF Transcript_87776/g.283448 Transcript_87776/m.283448 type:complete len:686 (+) Transcript_87776:559-2616(+)